MESLLIPLKRQPPVRLSCTFIPSPPNNRSTPANTLIIFISGIDNPQKWWFPTISALSTSPKRTTPMLTYDRPGCGTTTDRNPDVVIPGRPRGHGRDLLDAAHDLRELVISIGFLKLGIKEENIDTLRLVFVANSIGVAIARLYSMSYPKTVSGLLILDSTIANSDTISIFPDPDAPSFQEETLLEGVSKEMCRVAREKVGKGYHILGPTREGLWRGTISTLLPYADCPKLEGPVPDSPYVTVVEHDMELFPRALEKVNS
jgi:pimeloyl-ACP methyl ester carboxylesterase